MDFSDWSQMRQFDEPSKEDKGNHLDQQKKPQTSLETKKGKEEKVVIDLTSMEDKTGDLASSEISDWNDLRKLDDDHDGDWFSCQENKLAEQYGGDFIKVKYAEHGRVMYFCELCVVECNAKKSLELHCSGMKHLRKKDIWEKEGKPHLLGNLAMRSESGPKSQNEPPPPNMSRDRRARSPFLPRRRNERSRSRSRDRRPPWERERRGRSPSREREPFERFPQREYSRDSYDGSRGPPPLMKDRYSSPPRNSWSGSGYDRDGRDRFNEPPRRRTPSPDRYARPFENRGGYSDPVDTTPCPPSPPRFSTSKSYAPDKINLTSSPASSLLQKLSECCVKTVDDADLAMNVVASLARSLKEYSQRNGENKIAELLTEAELKIGTVKALKVGMKMLSSFADSTQPPKSDSHGERDLFNMIDSGSRFSNSPMGGMMNPPPPYRGPSKNSEMGSFLRGPPPGRSDPFMEGDRQMAFNPPPPNRHNNMPWK